MTPEQLVLLIGGFWFGAATGSFIGCAIYRVPRGISLIKGRSACPSCGHQLTPLELIPILSWIMQAGKCRRCGVKLSATYVLAEFLCGLIGLATVYILIA